MYFHCEASTSEPSRVRAPHTTWPMLGKARRQLTPSGLRVAVLGVGERGGQARDREPEDAAQPGLDAGRAFHTPRSASVRLMMPATAPLGAKSARLPS